jgi:hypothetical protein
MKKAKTIKKRPKSREEILKRYHNLARRRKLLLENFQNLQRNYEENQLGAQQAYAEARSYKYANDQLHQENARLLDRIEQLDKRYFWSDWFK